MYNSIIRQGYLDAYLKQVSRYQYEYRGSVVTYYHLNQDQSTYDSNLLVGGSYERVGDLSGLRFDKIINFYVSGSEEIVPSLNANELGSLVDYRTTIMFPDVDLTPTMYDFLQFTVNGVPTGPLFQVVNFEFAYMNPQVKIFKCSIKGVGIPIDKINQQVVGYFGYTDLDHKIHEINEYYMLMKSLQNIVDISPNILIDNITSSVLME